MTISERLACQAVLSENIKRLFEACGVDPTRVEPRPIGQGGNHRVYRYGGDQVVKVPINPRLGTVESPDHERANIDNYLEYFPQFSVPTTFLPSDIGYCVTMSYVDGRVITRGDVYTDGVLNRVGLSIGEMVESNSQLLRETGMMIDLVGLPGMFWLAMDYPLRSDLARLTNVKLDSNNRPWIVDYDMIPRRKVRKPFTRLKSFFAYHLNRLTIGNNFGIHYP